MDLLHMTAVTFPGYALLSGWQQWGFPTVMMDGVKGEWNGSSDAVSGILEAEALQHPFFTKVPWMGEDQR